MYALYNSIKFAWTFPQYYGSSCTYQAEAVPYNPKANRQIQKAEGTQPSVVLGGLYYGVKYAVSVGTSCYGSNYTWIYVKDIETESAGCAFCSSIFS